MARTERWRPIPGYEGRYDVSDQGQVRSWLGRWPGRPLPFTLKLFPGHGGYLQLRLADPGGSMRNARVHKLVLLAFRGPPPPGMQARHADGNPTNNRLSNLNWSSRSRNMRDAVRHGTHVQASKAQCPAGHSYDAGNTITRHGKRECRICERTWSNNRNRQARRARRMLRVVERWRRMRRNGDLDYWAAAR